MDSIQKFFIGSINQTTPLATLHILLVTIVPFMIAFILNHLLQRYIKIPLNMQSSRKNTYFSVFKSIIATIIYSMAFFYILSELKINLTPIFASAGIISIIIGLGIRSLVEDFFSGMFILTQDTVRVGDYVEIGLTNGVIESLGFRTIRVKDQNECTYKIIKNHGIRHQRG
jgi:small conductance mechanosensitive channel